ncbi:MAG: ABC transporter substrate-binding protein, partial [Pseudolysinimonas sp.]
MRVRLAATALVTAAALLLAGCAGGAAPSPSTSSSSKPVAGGDATIVVSGRSWSHLDIAAPQVTPIKDLLSSIYDSMVRMDPKGNVIPWLAKSWEESADGLSWTFHLRDGVMFTDGTPFNSEAVKFNIARQLDPNQRAGEAGNLPKGTTVETPDPLTAVFKFTAPDESILSALASTAIGFMASPTAIQKFGNQYGLNPVGTGPFMFDKQVIGQSLHLVKNPKYWVKGEPYLNSVTYQVLGSADSALQTLKSGGAEIMNY